MEQNQTQQTDESAARRSLQDVVRRDVFGWFDSPTETTPAHDPGIESAVCPLCGNKLSRPVVTTSLMPMGGDRSYFFRTHKSCHLAATEGDIASVESSLIDTLAPNARLNDGAN